LFGDPRTEIVVMLYAQVRQIDGESYRNILLTHRYMIPQILEAPPSLALFVAPTPKTRDLTGVTLFPERQVESILAVLAVELLPGDNIGKSDARRRQNLNPQDFQVDESNVGLADESGSDPIGTGLGSRRILRTSPLTPVPPIC
jgi:hypothetical protein